jgi:hypothetical protein
MMPPEYYRAKAEECRREAAKAKFQSENDGWRELAEKWLSLARDVEPKRGQV